MKKTIVATIIFLLFAGTMSAQSPAIQQFRQVVAARDTQFKNLQNVMVQENAAEGIQMYSSTIADTAIAKSVIVTTKTEGTMYVISYDITKMDEMMIRIFMPLVEQYMAEINTMIKSGNYTGRDFIDEGRNITEVSDTGGNVVAQYISNNDSHMIMVFGK